MLPIVCVCMCFGKTEKYFHDFSSSVAFLLASFAMRMNRQQNKKKKTSVADLKVFSSSYSIKPIVSHRAQLNISLSLHPFGNDDSIFFLHIFHSLFYGLHHLLPHSEFSHICLQTVQLEKCFLLYSYWQCKLFLFL